MIGEKERKRRANNPPPPDPQERKQEPFATHSGKSLESAFHLNVPSIA